MIGRLVVKKTANSSRKYYVNEQYSSVTEVAEKKTIAKRASTIKRIRTHARTQNNSRTKIQFLFLLAPLKLRYCGSGLHY